jgi:ubiquinone/menaquinone biosynthesis C-methylase UbiE
MSYKIRSKFYRLLDTIYFKNNSKNPRYILLNKVPNNDLKILEVAVGTAENIVLLAKNKPKLNIIGIDLSEEMLKIAINKIKNEKFLNVELIKMNGLNMTFNNETFDYKIISLLHELPEEISDKI